MRGFGDVERVEHASQRLRLHRSTGVEAALPVALVGVGGR